MTALREPMSDRLNPSGKPLGQLMMCRVCGRHPHILRMEMCAWCTYGWTERPVYERVASDRHVWYWEPYQARWRVITCCGSNPVPLDDDSPPRAEDFRAVSDRRRPAWASGCANV